MCSFCISYICFCSSRDLIKHVIFYGNFYWQTEDLSLRDASTNCIVTIVSQFGRLEYDEYAYKTVIEECLLQEVKSGLRNRFEVNTLVINTYRPFGLKSHGFFFCDF